MARVLRKMLKKLGNTLRSCATLEKMNLEAETDTLLNKRLSEKESDEKDLEGHFITLSS